MRRFIAVIGILGMGAAQAAGTVKVSFIEPQKFTDAANSRFEIPVTLKAIEEHLQGLGQRHLADGQTLTIEVLDIDLAGTMYPAPRTTVSELRIVRGSADWPRIDLRYTLDSPGQPTQRGEERVDDMGYQMQIQRYFNSEPLRYEKQMLDDWFKARFAPAQ
jgi:Protein of unknown function (DUF3016)